MGVVQNGTREVLSQGKEQQTKLERLEKSIAKLQEDVVALQDTTCAKADFEEAMKEVDEFLALVDKRSACSMSGTDRTASYLENYMNIRIQNIIATTLRGCLTGVQRRNHEKYDQEKMQLLYKAIIDDEGRPGDIERLITKLNEEAKRSVEEYEEAQGQVEEAKK